MQPCVSVLVLMSSALVLVCWRQAKAHTVIYIIAFWHLPPISARNWYATEGAFFMSLQPTTDVVSALRKVWVLIRLWKQHSIKAPVSTWGTSTWGTKKKKRVPSWFKGFWFHCAGNMGGYKRNARYNLSWLLRTFWAATTTCLLAKFWELQHNQLWRCLEAIINQCLGFEAKAVKEMTFQVQLLCSLSGAGQCICPFLDTPGGGLRLSKRWPSRCSRCYCARCQERSHVFVHVYRQGEVTSSVTFCSFYACP